MVAKVTFFPVGNGDMTLIELESGRRILIDVNARAASDDLEDDTPDVMQMLRKRLERDAEGRWYVDAFLLSHPHKDHCTGLRNHFHLGPPAEWTKSTDKILIREIWSSPLVFRRASRLKPLCDDAKAFNSEVRRRVQRFRDADGAVTDGDRILVLGEDEDGKTDDLGPILITVDSVFSRVNGNHDSSMQARLLAPHPRSEDEEEEEARAHNLSSTILNFMLAGDSVPDVGRFLTGGDAEVAIWERLWKRHSMSLDWLRYDILQSPHHCSWHSLSFDSWSEMGESAKVCDDARSALSQARRGAAIVASSIAIKDDDDDPPCIRAKREYEDMAADADGFFICVGEPESDPGLVEFEIGRNGPRKRTRAARSAAIISSGAIGRQPLSHG
ncbi:MAG TPA: metallohydrolase [Chloroflexota bacterium]|nr:metallohydrolase [Chloroflexota bacterium]